MPSKYPCILGPPGERGHPRTNRVRPDRPVNKRGKLNKRSALAREVAREVGGFAPYEKRILELLKNSLDKRALRLAKKRLGTHRRAIRKREEMATVIRMTASTKPAASTSADAN